MAENKSLYESRDSYVYRIKKWLLNRWLLGILAAFLLYTLAGYFLVPVLMRHFTPKLAADFLQRPASVGAVRFDPFRFILEARDIALNEADGTPILELGRLYVDFVPGGYVRKRTLIFAELRLERPSINLVLGKDGQLNLARLGDNLPQSEESPATSEGPLPALYLEHLAIVEGKAKFTDLMSPQPITETVEHLKLELDHLSTQPDHSGNYQIDALLPNGAWLGWKGDLSVSPIASRGEVKLGAYPLKTAWKFFKDRFNLAEPGGTAALSARYRFAYGKDRFDLTLENADLKLAGVQLARLDSEAPLLNLQEIGFEKASFDLGKQTIRIPEFAVRNGEVAAAMDPKGNLDWLGLVKPEPPNASPQPAAPPPPTKPSSPWKVSIENFEIGSLRLRYADASRKAPIGVTVGDFGLALSMEAEVGAGTPKARIESFQAHLDRAILTQTTQAKPLLGWDVLTVEGGPLDLEKQEVSIQKAAIKGGRTAIVREANGTLRPLDLFMAPDKPASKADRTVRTETSRAEKPADAKPWRFTLNEFTLEGFKLGYTDRTLEPVLTYDLQDTRISVKNISSDGKTPLTIEGAVKFEQGGTLEVSGTASPTGDAAKARVKFEQFDLTPLQAYVGQHTTLVMRSAELSTDLAVEFRQSKATTALTAIGKLGLNDLALDDTHNHKRFLAWKSLDVNDFQFGLAPDRLAAREIRILEPYSTIAIAKDKTTNLEAVAKSRKPAPSALSSSGTAKAKPVKDEPFPMTIDRVVLTDGRIDFSDLSLVLPFTTHIYDFDGAVSGFSLSSKNRATLKFEGRVDQYGEAKVEGTLNPLAVKDHADVRVAFRNVAMASLSPYSATFAGRKIESGKLNLDIRYQLDQGWLKNQNDIALQDFTLGEYVESPGAISLPLDLAIALLTDSDGRIKASVPIEGNVNDPRFAYGGLVWDALANLIKKVVSAPFTAIGSLFGGSAEKLENVMFEAAHDRMPPPQKERLAKVARALAQRPQLQLTVHGRYNPQADGDALKSLAVRRALAEKLGIGLAPGEEPDAVAYGSADTQRALEKLAKERGNPQAIDQLVAEFRKETGKPPHRIGLLGGMLGRGSETPDFYQKLFLYLAGATPLPQSDLESLATRRGRAIQQELLDVDSVDPSRLTLGPIESTDDGEDGQVPSRLELGAE